MAIEAFYIENSALPGSLGELELDTEDLRDPETSEKYGYVVEDGRRYRISARFALADDEDEYWYDGKWKHGSGLHEFLFTVPDR